jgi:pimeloyl-ACP methyl ester carboxylesterase
LELRTVDIGSGPPVVVIPGIQGRWEWMRPGIEALARRCRVITFSFADEPTCGGRFEEANGFDCYVEQVYQALSERGLTQASICGVSYGGLVAAVFAARYPARASSLVLVSPLPPSWTPDARVRLYLRAPRLLSPVFFVRSIRLYREIAAAADGRLAALRTASRHTYNVLTHMLSPSRMTRRVRLLGQIDFERELRGLMVPTLLVTGHPGLERVIPVNASREYLALWPHIQVATLDRTGHLGIITRPDTFAAIVAPFVTKTGQTTDSRRQVV